MGIRWQALSGNVFLISEDGRRPLLYAPLQGVILEANDAYVERFREALAGDGDAARAIGLEPDSLERFATTPEAAARTLDPAWPAEFEPTSVTLFLTHKCTLRCSYCYCHGGEGRDIDWPVLERAVSFALENAQRLGRDLRVSFHGGDVGAVWPLFERAVEFVEQVAEEAGVKVAMNIGTNGFYSAERARYLAAHMRSATLSIDGLPEVHDRYRATQGGKPSLDTVLRTARIFEKAGLSYSIRMTVTAESVPRLAESVAFLCEHTGAQTIRAEPLYSRGRANESNLEAPDPERFVEAFREASAVAASHGRRLTYSGARISNLSSAFCSYPRPTFGVTPDGDLSCCYEILHPDDPLTERFYYGSIEPDGSSLVVDGDRIDAIRAGAKERREACAHCFCASSCAGDCAAKTIDTGSPAEDGSSARCDITRVLVLDLLRAALAGEDPGAPAKRDGMRLLAGEPS